MKNRFSTKRQVVASLLATIMTVSMLMGTTFAWFTDSVTSSGNVIKTGNLDVVMEWTEGKNDPAAADTQWTDAEGSTIFGYELWEPGYVQARHIRITNNGTLALKYLLQIVPEGTVSELAEVIDVYVSTGNVAIDKSLEGMTKLGTLDQVIDSIGNTVSGTLVNKGDSDVYTIAFKMQETAGNNYMNLSVGDSFTVKLLATQLTAENDSFDNTYDEDAVFCDVLATPETLDDILASVKEGTTIGLKAGYYDEITVTQDGLTLIAASNESVVGYLNLNAKDGITIDNLTFDQNGAKATYTFESGNVQKSTGYVANITGDTNSPSSADNVVIRNCVFTNTSGVAAAAESDYAPIYFNESGAATKRASNISVKNCIFACNAKNYIVLNYLAVGETVIANNVFGGGNYGTAHNTINATANASNWTITGNSFNNWSVVKTAIGSSKQGSNTVSWTITDNLFNNDIGAVVLALKTSYNADNSVVTFNNNTALNGTGSIVATETNNENETVYAGRKIAAADGVVYADNNDDLKTAIADNNTICLPAGEYTLPTMNGKEGITIIGTEGTVIVGEDAATGFGGNFGNNTTIKNVTFSGSESGVRWSYANGGESTFENCTFAGDSTYGFHIDGGNGATFTFNNCTFIGFNAFAGDLERVVFNNCTFLSNGSCGHTNIWSVGEFNNCVWGDNTSVSPAGSGKLYFGGTEESYHHEFIGSAESLVGFAGTVNGGDNWKGQKVVLVNDIDLADVEWAPIDGAKPFNGTFDGNGHTISNLTVKGERRVGFFAEIGGSAVIENLTFDNANVSGTHFVAVIVAGEWNENGGNTIKNCTVTNSTVTCDTDSANDNGDKVGGICGYATGLKIIGCTVSNTTIKAYRDLGGILGYANSRKTTVKDCTVDNVTLFIDDDVNYKNYTTDAEHHANSVVGQQEGEVVVENNTVKNN